MNFQSCKMDTWQMHKNKQKPSFYSVSNGTGASSFQIWIANLAQLLTLGTLTNSQTFIFGDSNWKFCSRLLSRHPKTWQLWFGIFFNAFIFEWKKIKTSWIHKNNVFASLEKYSELKLLFGIYYWFLKLYNRIIWHSYFSLHGISKQKGSGWSGAKCRNGLMKFFLTV